MDSSVSGCSVLSADLVFQDKVSSIGVSAFKECSGITSAVFGKGMQSIGKKAFEGYRHDSQLFAMLKRDDGSSEEVVFHTGSEERIYISVSGVNGHPELGL